MFLASCWLSEMAMSKWIHNTVLSSSVSENSWIVSATTSGTDISFSEEDITMSLNVAPATGMSPAEVAQELRVLIRDQMLQGVANGNAHLKNVSPITIKNQSDRFLGALEGSKSARVVIMKGLQDLSEASSRRKPSEMRVIIASIGDAVEALRAHTQVMEDYSSWAFTTLTLARKFEGTGNKLTPLLERAYALVQALPTMDNSPVTREATAIRAITAILKVYHGVDSEGTAADLPPIMSDLLQALKNTTVEDGKKIIIATK